MKKEFEILERYQNSDEVKTLVAAIENDTPNIGKYLDQLMDIENKMMLEAGMETNEYGQFSCDDAAFFDLTLKTRKKIHLLEECEGDQSERIAYLKEKLKFSNNLAANKSLIKNENDSTATTAGAVLSLDKATVSG